MQEQSKLIEEVISFMALNDPFNFTFLLKMRKIAVRGLGTMGVGVLNERVTLKYDPELMDTLTKEELRYMLAHEVGHVALHHITHRSSHDKKRAELENIAMDLAINSLLPDDDRMSFPRCKEDVLSETGEILLKKGDKNGQLPEMYGFPPRLSAEQYIALLEEKFKGQGEGQGEGQGQGGGQKHSSFDNHDEFGENAEVDALIREIVKKIEKNRSWGNTPGGFKEAILKAQVTEVPWWQFLRRFLGDFISSEKTQTRRKPNRRLGYPFFGETNEYIGKAYAYVDTSASVGSAELAKFTAEVEKLNEYMPVVLYMFDTAVQDPDGKPQQFHEKKIKSITFNGRGGTNFQAPIDHAHKRRVPYVIIFSDGECSKPDVPRGMRILWVITPGHQGSLDGWPGKVVYMKNR